MPGSAQLIVAGIVLLTLTLSGVGVYLRYGPSGLMLTGLMLVVVIVGALFEGIGTALLTRLLHRIWPDKPKSSGETPAGRGGRRA